MVFSTIGFKEIIKLSFLLDSESVLSNDNSNLFKNLTRLCIMSDVSPETLPEWFKRKNLEHLEVLWLIINSIVFVPYIKTLRHVIMQSNQNRFEYSLPLRNVHTVFENHDEITVLLVDVEPFKYKIFDHTCEKNYSTKIFAWKNKTMTPLDLQDDYLNLISDMEIIDVDKLEINIYGINEDSELNAVLVEWINKSNIQRKIQKMAVNDIFMENLNDENKLNLFSKTPNMEIFEVHAARSSKYKFNLRNLCYWNNLKELTLIGIHNDMKTFPQVADNLCNLEVFRVEVFSINGLAYYNISNSLPKFRNLKEFKYMEPISLVSLNKMFTSLSRCNNLQCVYISINSLGKFNKRDFVFNCVRVLQINSVRFFGLVVPLFHSSDIQFLRKSLKKQAKKEMSIYISSMFDSNYASEFPLFYQMRYIRTESRVADRTLQNYRYFCNIET